MPIKGNKSEYQISKSETMTKIQVTKIQNRREVRVTLARFARGTENAEEIFYDV